MIILIIGIAVLIIIAGILLTMKPEIVLDFLDNEHESTWVHVVAVVVRIILGALLITQSGASKYPIIIAIFGWLSLLAAGFLLLIGRSKFQQLVRLIVTIVRPYGRVGGLLSIAFGAFLIYAFA